MEREIARERVKERETKRETNANDFHSFNHRLRRGLFTPIFV